MYSLKSIQGYKAYFEALATAHTDITQFIYGDDDIFTKESASVKITGKALWLDYYRPVRVVDKNHDNFLGDKKATIMIMAAQPKKHADREQMYFECEAIVEQLLARIHYDWYEQTLVDQPIFDGAQFGEAMDMPVGGSIFCGCRLEIGFYHSINMQYDAAKWGALPVPLVNQNQVYFNDALIANLLPAQEIRINSEFEYTDFTINATTQ